MKTPKFFESKKHEEQKHVKESHPNTAIRKYLPKVLFLAVFMIIAYGGIVMATGGTNTIVGPGNVTTSQWYSGTTNVTDVLNYPIQTPAYIVFSPDGINWDVKSGTTGQIVDFAATNATAAIQYAITSANSNGGGIVSVVNNLTISSSVNMASNVQLQLLGNVTINADINGFVFANTQASQITGNITVSYPGYTQSVIYMTGGANCQNNNIHNLQIILPSGNGYGISVLMASDYGCTNAFSSISIYNGAIGININTTGTGCFGDNVFTNIMVWYPSLYGFLINSAGSATNCGFLGNELYSVWAELGDKNGVSFFYMNVSTTNSIQDNTFTACKGIDFGASNSYFITKGSGCTAANMNNNFFINCQGSSFMATPVAGDGNVWIDYGNNGIPYPLYSYIVCISGSSICAVANNPSLHNIYGTDAAVVINNAASAAETALGSGFIYICPGNYPLASPLTFSNNVTIMGAGIATNLFANYTGGTYSVTIDSKQNIMLESFQLNLTYNANALGMRIMGICDNLCLNGLTICNIANSGYDAIDVGVPTGSVTNVKIQNCNIYNIGKNGISTAESLSGLIITNNMFSNCTHAAFLGAGTNIIVTGNLINNCGGNYGLDYGNLVNYLTITDNVFNTTFPVGHYSGTPYVVISGNQGFPTFTQGSTSMSSNSSVAVTFLIPLAASPTAITVTPEANGYGTFWVSGVSASGFTLNANNTGSYNFFYTAYFQP
jgi:hypothetical protein